MTTSITILLLALAQVETADVRHPNGNDHHLGKYGEVSRYSITPKVWKQYAAKGEVPTRKADADKVVSRFLACECFALCADVKPADIYAAYHRPALYRKAHYRVDRLPPKVRARCLRFQNLVEDLERKQRE